MKDPKDMTGDELNYAVAELCGAKWMRLLSDASPVQKRSLVMPAEIDFLKAKGLSEADGTEDMCQIHRVPNYAGDLNAMHEAVSSLDEMQKVIYRNILIGICEGMNRRNWSAIDATARERAEAFIMAMSKEDVK